MNVKKNDEEVTCLEFSKYNIKNYKVDQIDLFDVTTEGLMNIPPDFDEGKPLFHKYYCTCLLHKSASYHFSQLSPFLDHQFKTLKYPDRWLRSFDSLLDLNRTYFLNISSENKYKILRRCIKEKLRLLNRMVREDEVLYGRFSEDRMLFDIDKIKKDLKSVRGFENKKNILLRWKADYQQEFVNQKNDTFIKQIDIEIKFLNKTKNSIDHEPKIEKIKFYDTAAQLVNLIGQLLMIENKNGLLFRGSINASVHFICSMITDKDGKPFLESTILRNLTEFNAGNLSKKNKIDLNLDLNPDLNSNIDSE